MELNIKFIYYYSIGFLIIFNQITCNEVSTPITVSFTEFVDVQENTLPTTTTLSSTQPTTVIPTTLQETTTLPATTTLPTTTVTLPPAPLLTTHLHHVVNDESIIDVTNPCLIKNQPNSTHDNADDYSISTIIDGDITVVFILHQHDNATSIINFMVNHINEIDLLINNVTIGVRVLQVNRTNKLQDIMQNEIDYLENCVDHPFGIFLSNDLWHSTQLQRRDLDIAIWPLPPIESVKFRKVAHLLNELPWSVERINSSIEVRADSLTRSEQFQNILRKENLCIKSFTAEDHVYVVVGTADSITSMLLNLNGSMIIVPLSLNNLMMADIPDASYIVLESDIDSSHNKSSPKNSTSTPSEFILFGSAFLEICKSINNAIWKNCNNTIGAKLNLSSCEIYHDLLVPKEIPTYDVKKLLQILNLEHLENHLTLNIFQKFTSGANETSHSSEIKKISTTNFATNITTVYMDQKKYMTVSLGSLMQCHKTLPQSSQQINKTIQHQHENSFDLEEITDEMELDSSSIEMDDGEMINMYWQIKSELWVAIGLTISTLGILLCLAILTFIVVRICMEDVLEGNPIGSVVVLLALIVQFASFFPFTIEYVGFRPDLHNAVQTIEVYNSMCIIKIFLVSVCYCLTFSLLVSRAIMLASIGSEGGFLSHVNGYLQTVICVFSFLVQVGLSSQLLIMMHANTKHVTCENVFYGNWFWGIIAYDGALLGMLVFLSPFIFKSQRNYQEGILLVICAFLCLLCWTIWIPLSMINHNFREMMVPLGVQATGWIVLSSLMVPRCFLIVRSIARSDFTQALPSLTSLAFAQANQFISEPSIYECVNPTMRNRSNEDLDETEQTQIPNDYTNEYPSPNEVPTLPLRGGRRNFIDHYNLNFNEIVNPDLPSPNKITRF